MASEPAAPPRVLADAFVRYEVGRRNRRTLDAILLGAAVLVVGAAAAVSNAAPVRDADLGDVFVTLLGWGEAAWRTIGLVTIVVCALLLVAVVVRRRWLLGRDALL